MQTNPKQLIKCLTCRLDSREVVLGAIGEDGGYLAILGHNRSIKIVGDSFGVICAKCGSLVYFKEAAKENLLTIKVSTLVLGTN